MKNHPKKPTVFISYSHKDETWKDKLVTQLAVLQQEGLLNIWEDRQVTAGEEWYQKIQEAIETAKVAILLISAEFLTSNFIQRKEVPRLLKRRKKEGLRIFPVIIKPCPWKQVKWLASMNLCPKYGRPISGGKKNQIETDLTAIAGEVADIINNSMEHSGGNPSSIDDIDFSWEDLCSSIEELARELKKSPYLRGFSPDIFLGISRGGIIVADLLSRNMGGKTPVLCLWADRYINYPESSFSPPENKINSFMIPLLKKEIYKNILIVDDICLTGGDCRKSA